jgi:putative serine protease PepD
MIFPRKKVAHNVRPWWETSAPSKSSRGKIFIIALLASCLGGFLGVTATGGTIFNSANIVSSSSTIERAPDSVAGIAARVLPSVVSINTRNSSGRGGTGSGFVFDSNGYILTNNHVIAGVANGNGAIRVTLSNGDIYSATIIGRDTSYDLAIIKISGTNLPALEFGDSDQVAVGDSVIAIGSPLGLSGTVTLGIISAKDRAVTAGENDAESAFINALQTDAAINTGNSGGPLFNIEGKVIGLNTSIPDVGGGTNIGIGFAIPAHTVQDIMNQLKEKGKISRGRLDIAIQEVTKELAEALSLSEAYGVLIVDVRAGGAGDKAGLKRGDLITEFNGQIVLNSRKLQLFVADIHIGEKVKLTIIRDNKPINLVAKIVELEQPKEEIIVKKEMVLEKSGIIFANLSPLLVTKFDLNEDNQGIVVIEIAEEELNFDLRVGDLITAINQQQISDIEQFDSVYAKIKNEKKQSVVLLVKRGEVTMFVALPIK